MSPREQRFDALARSLGPRVLAWEGLSPAEAAGVLGLAPAAARKRLQRARERLARELGEEAQAAARVLPAG